MAASDLSFTSDLVPKPQDESMTELRQYAALQLIATNNLEELILTTEMIHLILP